MRYEPSARDRNRLTPFAVDLDPSGLKTSGTQPHNEALTFHSTIKGSNMSFRNSPRWMILLGLSLLSTWMLVFRDITWAGDLKLHGDAKVHFASPPEAWVILSTRDRFVAAMSPFDRQARLETGKDVTEVEYLEFAASHVQQWTDEQTAKLTRVIAALRPKLARFRLPFPATVVLVQTSGREEGQAAYCRGNAVILPSQKLAGSEAALERLLNHELFHILSSHHEPTRDKLYAIVGFRPCAPIDLPATLRSRKLTNPDAPWIDSLITLRDGGETLTATPVLYANTERYDPQRGGPFFRYLTFRLLVVRQNGDGWEPDLQNAQPRLLEAENTADYGRQIGRNTGYILHPDEILADNFVHLVQQTPDLPSPQIIEQMRDILAGEGKN